ncbi:hypothetical protein GCM10010981_32410 [Dyella nitratireducens]|uniref:Sulfotransferase domain-containing protein n=2 Tax=Dyella nitratireducens TaxID=1849580 RepID=A0ABQ1GBY2_9GAMM|nr:hypothetical protein GCM10010981_32410 [Dyella nitratireducens]GLQ40599.1 hypothetical protein GCM10007902_04480 [Dyella nitratireducens]
MESRCARILGEYLNAALLVAHDPLCCLVDYKDISLNKALEIAKFFNIATRNDVDMSALEATLSKYSKDPNAARLYSDDTLLKQGSASNQLREEINVRARPFYERLLGQLH